MIWWPRGPFVCQLRGRRRPYRLYVDHPDGWFPSVRELAGFAHVGTAYIARVRQASEVLIVLVVERDGIVHARNMSSIDKFKARGNYLGVHCGQLTRLRVEDFRARRPGEAISCDRCFAQIERALESYYKRSTENERVRDARAARSAA